MSEMYDWANEPDYTDLMAAGFQVFGRGRMWHIIGNEASAESTGYLCNAIAMLCQEYEDKDREMREAWGYEPIDRRSFSRTFDQLTGGAITINANSANSAPYINDALNQARYNITPTAFGRTTPPPGMPWSRRYKFAESIFVDSNNKAMVHRLVYTTTRREFIGAEAVKPATEEEVQEAITQLASAVRFSDEKARKRKQPEAWQLFD